MLIKGDAAVATAQACLLVAWNGLFSAFQTAVEVWVSSSCAASSAAHGPQCPSTAPHGLLHTSERCGRSGNDVKATTAHGTMAAVAL